MQTIKSRLFFNTEHFNYLSKQLLISHLIHLIESNKVSVQKHKLEFFYFTYICGRAGRCNPSTAQYKNRCCKLVWFKFLNNYFWCWWWPWIQSSSLDLEALVTSQCEELIEAIRSRHAELLTAVRDQRARKHQAFSDRLAECTQRLHRTTGLLQFGVKVLKEADPTAFLLVSLTRNLYSILPYLLFAITPIYCGSVVLKYSWMAQWRIGKVLN